MPSTLLMSSVIDMFHYQPTEPGSKDTQPAQIWKWCCTKQQKTEATTGLW